MYEVVYRQFWRQYVTWFGADAPKTYESLLSDFTLARVRAAVAEWLKAHCLNSKTWVPLST